MATIRQIADGKVIMAYGTSEGAKKAWDTRGRGRKKSPTDSDKSRIAAPEKKEKYERLKQEYEMLGKRLEKAHGKLDDITEVKSTWGKFMHFLRDLGEWHDAWGNVKDLVLEVAAGVWLLKGVAHAQTIHNTLTWAYTHLAPVVHQLGSGTGSASLFGSEEDFKADRASLRAMIDGESLNG